MNRSFQAIMALFVLIVFLGGISLMDDLRQQNAHTETAMAPSTQAPAPIAPTETQLERSNSAEQTQPPHSDAAFSLTDRDTFRGEVRAYLLENPEVLMEAIAVLEQRQADQAAVSDAQLLATNMDALVDDGFSWVGGNPDGDITIVEFMDYQCGYCKQAHPEVAELLATDDNIRLIIKEYPILGEGSVLASRFAVATKLVAGDDAYRTVGNALMALRGGVSEDSLRALAENEGLDADEIFAGMDDPEVQHVIAQNRALGQRLKINGTPSFVFGDQMVRGYVPLEGMQQIVAALRAE